MTGVLLVVTIFFFTVTLEDFDFPCPVIFSILKYEEGLNDYSVDCLINVMQYDNISYYTYQNLHFWGIAFENDLSQIVQEGSAAPLEMEEDTYCLVFDDFSCAF